MMSDDKNLNFRVESCFGKSMACVTCGEQFATSSAKRDKCYKCESAVDSIVTEAEEAIIRRIAEINLKLYHEYYVSGFYREEAVNLTIAHGLQLQEVNNC